jgi:secreted trypsin-like serine protease
MQLIDDSWSLVGIVSNGDAMCTGKGIYTNISFYLEWILDKTLLN